MIKYAKVIDEKTKKCSVGEGNDDNFYKSIGMTKLDVELAYDNTWYLKGYLPEKPEQKLEEKVSIAESETGLTRVIREIVLSDSINVSDYIKNKALEIEDLAKDLRKE